MATDDDAIRAATEALAAATATLSRLMDQRPAGPTAAPDETATSQRSTTERTGNERTKVDQTRAGLLAAAGRVFAEKGYEGASVGDIAAAAGYTKGALYAHFGSKHELFLEFARDKLARDKSLAEDSPDVSCLADALTGNAEHVIDETEMLRGLEVMTFAVRHPEARGELAPLVAESIRWLAERIRDDRLDGADTKTPPSRADFATAVGIISVTNFTVLLRVVTGTETVPTEATAQLVRKLLD